jgi:hypothetical protein
MLAGIGRGDERLFLMEGCLGRSAMVDIAWNFVCRLHECH